MGGHWRLVCALPAVATSALLVTTAFGWLEKFTLAGVAGWLFAGTLLGLPGLERAAVRIGYRFHPPAPAGRDWTLLYSGRLTQDRAVAVGVHEVRHHMSSGVRYGLAIGWLSWPWRVSCQLVMRLCARMPFAKAVKMLMPVVFIVAAVMLVREEAPPEQVMPALVLLAVVALVVIHAGGLIELWRAGKHTNAELSELFSVARSTGYRAAQRAGECQA